MIRSNKPAKTNAEVSAPRPEVYRRFIPDARSSTSSPVRGHFWHRVWLSFRSAR